TSLDLYNCSYLYYYPLYLYYKTIWLQFWIFKIYDRFCGRISINFSCFNRLVSSLLAFTIKKTITFKIGVKFIYSNCDACGDVRREQIMVFVHLFERKP